MYTWNHNSACCLVFAMNIVSHIHVHSCTDQSDNVLLGPVPSTPHCIENMFLGDCKQTDWWHSISLMEEKQGPANCKKLGLIGEVKCQKGVVAFLFTNDTIPCKRCAGNQPARETGMAQLPHGFSLLQQHAPFAFSPFLTSQPSQSLRFPMNVSPVPCRIGQQWRWNCEFF